jgi:hypothetical protein
MVHGIRPDELPRLTPKLKPYLQRPNPAWPDIIDAAVCIQMGRSSVVGAPRDAEPTGISREISRLAGASRRDLLE